ncbi:hypothetical protein ANANG_G00175810 [Anguilla anguilla]|uniref:CA216 protein n=1 Tax=Anguilla anguilla TaxID=7936 RepID=A0A9D3M4A3_ANGAN|nr:hypothetical protein ANANG_G00175810 [Anguilla anguilla]
MNPVFGNQEAGSGPSSVCLISNSQQRGNRKCEKDGNFNFLGQENDILAGDENRNQLRSRVQTAPGRDGHCGSGALSPLSRLPCWSPLEPLPEIESGEEGRVPPEGAEGKMEEETGRGREEEEEKKVILEAEEEVDYGEGGEVREEGGEWGDSDSEFELSYRSSGSSSPLSTESGEGAGAGRFSSVWDRICVGSPRAQEQPAGGVEAVWTLRDREKFKAREMEKHQVQLTMYRRLALLRWLRTLQSRVQEQQNRLQSSFDIILTQRKELLRLGAATASQS